jgi:MFS family permease
LRRRGAITIRNERLATVRSRAIAARTVMSAPVPVRPARPTPALNPFRAIQRHRNFRYFWIGQTVSLIGSWMQTVGQGWLALELTNDAFLVGVVSAMGSLPVLLFSLYAGVLVDRQDKLRLVFLAQILFLAEAAALWWLTWTGDITVGWLITLATVQGIISSVEIPARQSLFVELVGREDLLDAIALNSSGFNLARIIGPGIAGLVIVHAGLAWCFAINALSYFAVLIGLMRIRLPAVARVPSRLTPLQGLVQGIRYMRSTPAVSALMRIVAVYAIFGVPYLVLMPVIARDVLGTGASGYGILLTSVGVGALIGALALAARARRIRRGRLLVASSYAFSVLLIVFSFVRSVPLATGVLLFTGLTMILNSALANGILQTVVPDELRGRVMSAYVFVYVGLSPIGSFVAGGVARAIGANWAIGGGGAIMLVYTVWAFWRYPAVKDL